MPARFTLISSCFMLLATAASNIAMADLIVLSYGGSVPGIHTMDESTGDHALSYLQPSGTSTKDLAVYNGSVWQSAAETPGRVGDWFVGQHNGASAMSLTYRQDTKNWNALAYDSSRNAFWSVEAGVSTSATPNPDEHQLKKLDIATGGITTYANALPRRDNIWNRGTETVRSMTYNPNNDKLYALTYNSGPAFHPEEGQDDFVATMFEIDAANGSWTEIGTLAQDDRSDYIGTTLTYDPTSGKFYTTGLTNTLHQGNTTVFGHTNLYELDIATMQTDYIASTQSGLIAGGIAWRPGTSAAFGNGTGRILAVPEPSGGALLMTACIAGLTLRRRVAKEPVNTGVYS